MTWRLRGLACALSAAWAAAAAAADDDGDGWDTSQGDCDDSNTAVHPGAVEGCDDLDNDCDGELDEPAGIRFDAYADGIDEPPIALIDGMQFQECMIFVVTVAAEGGCVDEIETDVSNLYQTGTWEPCDLDCPSRGGCDVSCWFAVAGDVTLHARALDHSAEVASSEVHLHAHDTFFPIDRDQLAGNELFWAATRTDDPPVELYVPTRGGSCPELGLELELEGLEETTTTGMSVRFDPQDQVPGIHPVTFRYSDDDGNSDEVTLDLEIRAPELDTCGLGCAPRSSSALVVAAALLFTRRERRA